MLARHVGRIANPNTWEAEAVLVRPISEFISNRLKRQIQRRLWSACSECRLARPIQDVP